MSRKYIAIPTIDIAQLIVNLRLRKREIAAMLVCLYRSLKLLTDDHSDFAAV